MGRFAEAIALPLIVFPGAAVVAIAIGFFLHQFPAPAHHGEVGAPALAALALTILVTGAGFFFDSRAGHD